MRAAGALLVLCQAAALGQISALTSSGLDLNALVAEALANNREIAAAQKRLEAARQRPREAGSLPDPTFSAGFSSNGYPYPGAGLGKDTTSNIGVSVTQPIPYPGKRQLRENVAAKDAAAEAFTYRQVQLSVVRRLKQAFFRLLHSYDATEVLGRNRDVLTELLRATELRYSTGKAAQQDVFKIQMQLSLLEAKILQFQQERSGAEAEILALVNRPPGSLLSPPIDIVPADITVGLEELYAHAVNQAPALQREQKLVERSEVALNLAHKNYYPDYSITGGYYNQGAFPPMYVVRFDMTVPSYYFRKQRAAVTGQYNDLAAARRDYEAADQSIHAQIRGDYTAAKTAFQLMTLYRNTAIPQAQLALESSLVSYQTGAIDFLPVLTNYLSIMEVELSYHDQMQNFREALTRLEESTGLTLIQGATP
jgi:outer membrane protein, heavy metal efflux system